MRAIPILMMILDTTFRATVLLALAGGVSVLLRKHSAATRHMVRVSAVAALLLLPLSVALLPGWQVKGLPSFVNPDRNASTNAGSATPLTQPSTFSSQESSVVPAAQSVQRRNTQHVVHRAKRSERQGVVTASPNAYAPERSNSPQTVVAVPHTYVGN